MKIKLGVDATAGLAISMEPHNDVTGVFVTSVHEPLHKCCHLELATPCLATPCHTEFHLSNYSKNLHIKR